MSDYQTALEQYDACIELQRTDAVEQSMEMLRKMTVDFPDFSLAYNALAAFYKKANNDEAAIASMEKYCALEPNDPFGFSVLSAYYIAEDQRAQAEEALGRANELRFKAQFGG
jgi:tetratricopeptide (TPR) repeat protein